MANAESRLVMAERHVREGHEHVRSQRTMLKARPQVGPDLELAEHVFAEFLVGLHMHRANLRSIRAGLNVTGAVRSKSEGQ